MESPQHNEFETPVSEVKDFVHDLKRFWDYIGNYVATLLLIGAVCLAGYNIVTRWQATNREVAWADLHLAGSPTLLNELVGDTGDDAVRAVAGLRAGDLLLAEARDPDAEITPEDALARAEAAYQAVLDQAPHPAYALNALEGLGVVAESRKRFDDAAGFYTRVKETAGDGWPAWSARAERRLALLPELTEDVVFAPDPEAPAEAPVSEPGEAGDTLGAG